MKITAKIKKSSQASKIQFVWLLLLAHVIPTLYIPLYFIIIEPNPAVWDVFVLLALMIAISWGVALLPILIYGIALFVLAAPWVYCILMLLVFTVLYSLYRFIPSLMYRLFIYATVLSVIAVLIYIGLFVAYLSGIFIPPAS
ncbi:hypothetical protein [Acinetobacter sp.]|uniref:hypothetical protein n=1 Tax=Acinetobacter sp. TaxID=472 RepID=UPI0028AC70B7|nr:hypothetical protein [Acinetobacter sp.]